MTAHVLVLKMAASPHLQRQAPALVMAASLLKSLAAGAAAEQVPKKLGICREGRMGKHMLERNGVDIGHQEARRIYRNCMVYCIVYNYIYIELQGEPERQVISIVGG